MCYDINKHKQVIKKDELESIDNITRVINSYDINELVLYKEFLCDDDEIRFHYEKCLSCCPYDDVSTMYHAFRHFNYLAELTFANSNQIALLRVFMQIHRDFQLEEYLIKLNAQIILNLKHNESGFNYFLTFDFSPQKFLLIKKTF